MSLQPRTGNGDACPQDAETHGRMWLMPASRKQYCPSSLHRGRSIYEYDGVTPSALTGADTPAAELRRLTPPAAAPRVSPEAGSQPTVPASSGTAAVPGQP